MKSKKNKETLEKSQQKERNIVKHPFFGMYSKEKRSVQEKMNDLRDGRHHDM